MTDMLDFIKNETNTARTENGAATLATGGMDCVDFFASAGALRFSDEDEIWSRFFKAFCEDRDIALKLLFYTRDVREGLGERRVFRVIIKRLASFCPAVVEKNIALFGEYGRFDDLLSLIFTPCENAAVSYIKEMLEQDKSALANGGKVSLLAKWLPSVNASNAETVRTAKHLAKKLGMKQTDYRKLLSALRARICLIENNLREGDYSFDYSKQPSKALFKYHKAFFRNDGSRYSAFLESVRSGAAALNTASLNPCDIIHKVFNVCERGIWGGLKFDRVTDGERLALDTSWNALADFTDGENYLAVVDGSGSMYCDCDKMSPIEVALSLGIYFAERNTGVFKNHFITFSMHPQLVEVKGADIVDKTAYCAQYNECANTDIQAVFELLLNAALKNGASQSDMPKRLYIISDMEFDCCAANADMTNFEYAKKLYAANGFELPELVFWNVNSRRRQQPVRYNEQGTALVSGYTPRIFSLITGEIITPYAVMMSIVTSPRYAAVQA